MRNHFNFPVYRIGKIWSINKKMPKEEAEQLSNYIESGWNKYFGKFLEQFKNLGIHNIGISDEKVRRKTEESPILTFPKFTFDIDGYQVKCRNSLAICSAHHNCKIWTRLTCLKQDNSLAYNLSAEDVEKFYRLAEIKGLEMIDIITPEYENIAKRFKKKVVLKMDYVFKIMASNSNDEIIRSIFDDFKRYLIQEMKDLVDNRNYLKALKDYFCLAFERKMTLSDYKSLIKNNDHKWFGYETYDYCSIFLTEIKNHFARFSGLSFNQLEDYSQESLPSEDSTRAVLRRFAHIF